MASPVDTTVKFFTSKMLGAPVLKGQAGSLIAILDACLVNGWGIQTATSVVVSGGVCTMTFPLDHAAPVEAVILVEGASIAGLNGEQKITAIAPNILRFATAAGNGTATGTITAKMAPAGWEKRFTGTNLAVYKSLDVQANGQFLRVNDANGLYARAIGYENMTAVSTGTGLFPSAAQNNGGLYWDKSMVAGAEPVMWLLVGDSRFFTVLTSIYQSNGPSFANYMAPSMTFFGDPVNFGRSADPFSTLIGGAVSAGSNSANAALLYAYSNTHRYMCRAVSGVGGAVEANIHPMSTILSADPMFDRISGRVVFSELVVKTGADFSWRAKLPGICTNEATSMEMVFEPLTVFSAGLPNRSYISHWLAGSAGNINGLNLLTIDVTGPWR